VRAWADLAGKVMAPANAAPAKSDRAVLKTFEEPVVLRSVMPA